MFTNTVINDYSSSGKIVQIRHALDPLIKQYFSPEDNNFSHIRLFTEVGGLDDITQFYRLGKIGGNLENYVLSIQPTDYPPDVVKNHLINQEGEAKKVYWYQDSDFVYGCMVSGRNDQYKNPIRVKTNPDGSLKTSRFRVREWNYVQADFLEIDGFRMRDQGRPVQTLIDEGRIGYFFGISNMKVYRALGGVPDLLCPFWHSDEFMTIHGKAYLPLVAIEGYGLTL